MSTLHYDVANYDIERANRAAEWTPAEQAEANLLARAQVHATLALVDAIRDLAPKTPEAGAAPGVPTFPSADTQTPPPASGPTTSQCVCGHNADVHDEETGHCRIKLRFRNGYTCACTGFEAQS